MSFLFEIRGKREEKGSTAKEERATVDIFTDGCSLGNPGPGGYACLIREDQEEVLLSGGEPHTTNNRMELMSVIRGLSYFSEQRKIRVYTDSEYVLKGATEWLPQWKRRGFRSSSGAQIKNKDLWLELDRWLNFHEVTFVKVPAHAGHPENEQVDKIAKKEAQKWRKNS